MELTDDCLDVKHESDTQLFQSSNREAPAAFFANEQYYLWTSGTNGWSPTTMHLYTSARPLGAFNASGLNNSQGWLIGWQPSPIPDPGQPGNQQPEQPGLVRAGSGLGLARAPRAVLPRATSRVLGAVKGWLRRLVT